MLSYFQNVVTRFMWVKVVDEAVFMFVCEKACRMVLVHVLKIVNFMSAVTTLCCVTDVWHLLYSVIHVDCQNCRLMKKIKHCYFTCVQFIG